MGAYWVELHFDFDQQWYSVLTSVDKWGDRFLEASAAHKHEQSNVQDQKMAWMNPSQQTSKWSSKQLYLAYCKQHNKLA